MYCVECDWVHDFYCDECSLPANLVFNEGDLHEHLCAYHYREAAYGGDFSVELPLEEVLNLF